MGRINYSATHKHITNLAPLEKLPMMWGMENGSSYHVKLKIFDENNGRVYQKARIDLSSHLTHKNSLTEYQNYMIFEGDVIGLNSFLEWVRQYGSSMLILEPKAAVDIMISSAQKRIQYYQDKL